MAPNSSDAEKKHDYDVCIFYESTDWPVAEQIANGLRPLRVFIDRNAVPVGDEFSDPIVHAIENSRAFIVVISENTHTSHYVKDEIARVLSRIKRERLKIPVIPVVRQREVQMPYGLAGRQPVVWEQAKKVEILTTIGRRIAGAEEPSKPRPQWAGKTAFAVGVVGLILAILYLATALPVAEKPPEPPAPEAVLAPEPASRTVDAGKVTLPEDPVPPKARGERGTAPKVEPIPAQDCELCYNRIQYTSDAAQKDCLDRCAHGGE